MTNDTPEVRQFARALCGRDDSPPSAPPVRRPNYVPREGGNTATPPDVDAGLRQWVSEMFYGYYDG